MSNIGTFDLAFEQVFSAGEQQNRDLVTKTSNKTVFQACEPVFQACEPVCPLNRAQNQSGPKTWIKTIPACDLTDQAREPGLAMGQHICKGKA
jgi:hypothetical protein